MSKGKLDFYAWLDKYHHITSSSLKHEYSEKEKKSYKEQYDLYLKS